MTLPSSVKVNETPPSGTGRSLPPATAFSPVQVPTIPGFSLGASLPGAPTATARPNSSDEYMGCSALRVSVLFCPLQGHDGDVRPFRGLALLRPLALAFREVDGEGATFQPEDSGNGLVVGHEVDSRLGEAVIPS